MQNSTPFVTVFLLLMALQVDAQLFPVRIDQRWGLMNDKGQIVVQTDYEHIGQLEKQDYYLVQKNGQLGAINKAGKQTLACAYENLMYLGQDVFAARHHGTWQVVNQVGQVLFDSLDASIEMLEDGFFSYQYEEKKGLAHCETGRILPPVYEAFSSTRTGWVEVVDTNGGKQWIDKNGQELLPRTMQSIQWNNGFYLTKRNDLWGLYDSGGNCLFTNSWAQQKYWSLGIYELINNHKKGLYIVQTGELLQEDFERIRLFNSRILELRYTDGSKGLLDATGRLFFRIKAEEISPIGYDFYKYKQGDAYGIIRANTSFKITPKYQYIGAFSERVALVCRDSKCGIINQNGEEVLPLIYEENFSVRDNQARYRPVGKPMQLFNFDENGQLEGRQEFAKIRSLRIGSAATRGRSSQRDTVAARTNIYQINDTLRWTYHARSGKWGLMNTKTQRYKYTPAWKDVYVLPKQGLTIVSETKMNIGGKLDLGRINMIYHQRLGIFNNEHGLPVTPMDFLDIKITDFTQDSLPVARCVFIGGKHGLINTRGRVIAKDYVYIGQFTNGKARATKKGRLQVDLQEKVDLYIDKAASYYQEMLANCTFDQDDDPRYFRQFAQVGRLHCVQPKWGYIDLMGQVVVDFQYDHAERYHRQHAVVIKEGRRGLLNKDGMELLAPTYNGFDFLPNTDSSLYLTHKNQQWKGAIDTLGQLIFPTQYKQVATYKEDRVAVQDTTGRWGFLDRMGRVVVPIEQRRVRNYKEGRAAFLKGHQWGFYDLDGTVSVPATYIRVGDFSEGKAWVQLPRGQRGYIDRQGKLLFKGRYSVLRDFHEGLAIVRISKKGWGIVDTSGNFVLKPKKRYRKITAFNSYGLAKVRFGKRYRLVDRAGKWVGKRSFGAVEAFSEGLAAVRMSSIGQTASNKSRNWKLIDTTGNFVSKAQYRRIEAFSEGLAKFKDSKGRYGYIDTQGQIAVPAVYIKASDFEAGKAVVWKAYNKTGILDSSGQVYIPIIHDKILAYSQGLSLVKKRNSGYGYMHDNAKPQTPVLYRAARPFKHQVALVKPQDKWGLINRQGLTVLSDKYDAITDFKEGAATVTINKFWGIVNDKGEVLLEPIYEQIEPVDNGLFRVEKANKVGYINKRGEWVWPMR
jgi:hypothetical protein